VDNFLGHHVRQHGDLVLNPLCEASDCVNVSKALQLRHDVYITYTDDSVSSQRLQVRSARIILRWQNVLTRRTAAKQHGVER